MDKASKRNNAMLLRLLCGHGDRFETSLKIEDLRSNKTTGKLSCFISGAAECLNNILYKSSNKQNQLMQ